MTEEWRHIGAPADAPPRRSGGGDGDAGVMRRLAEALGGRDVNPRRVGALLGVFHAALRPDTPVGFVHRGEAYLKAGPEAVTRYIAWGMRPFRPGPRQPLRGYWRVPPEVLADAVELRRWVALALDAARRYGRRPRPARRRKRPASERVSRQ